MILSTLWERYLLKEILKVFSIFIFGFYSLYILIDYSTHTKSFFLIETPFGALARYYLYQFSYRAPVLIPSALSLATIKVLCALNINRELLALQAGGIAVKKIMRPFFFSAAMLALLLILNYEYVVPHATYTLKHFEDSYFNEPSDKKRLSSAVNSLLLADNSRMIYQDYDPVKKEFYDACWIRSSDDIYRIKYLLPYEKAPYGYHVSHIVRNENNIMVQESISREMFFPFMVFDQDALEMSVIPYKEQAVSKLLIGTYKKNITQERKAQIRAALFFKMAMPLLCVLAVIGPAPFCIRFRRDLSTFFIYALGIFGMLGLITILNAGFVLGDSMVLPAGLAIWAPIAIVYLIFLRAYRSVRS